MKMWAITMGIIEEIFKSQADRAWRWSRRREEVRKSQEGKHAFHILVGATEHLIVPFTVIAIGGNHFSVKETMSYIQVK